MTTSWPPFWFWTIHFREKREKNEEPLPFYLNFTKTWILYTHLCFFVSLHLAMSHHFFVLLQSCLCCWCLPAEMLMDEKQSCMKLKVTERASDQSNSRMTNKSTTAWREAQKWKKTQFDDKKTKYWNMHDWTWVKAHSFLISNIIWSLLQLLTDVSGEIRPHWN